MSVPPDQLKQLMAARGMGMPGQMPGAEPAGQQLMGGAPNAAPINAPQSPEGNEMAATPKVEIAMKLLLASMPDLGVMSKKGATVYKALQMLQKEFGEGSNEDLVPAELQMLQQSMGPNADMQAMSAGGPPGGAPPGGMGGMPGM